MSSVRPCADNERPTVLAIVNAAAEAYRGAIPEDCWHEPYMPSGELDSEIAAGVVFWGYEADGALVGVMGIQPVQDVTLIRHAYVRTASQKKGIGAQLLAHLREMATGAVLIGTWADAIWAIRFYERNGFAMVGFEEKERLLRKYWSIPERQIETSVMMADSTWRGKQ